MHSLFYLPECASTQEEVSKFFRAENPGLTAVYTHRQTQGRGQYGNRWESNAGQNIAYSAALRTADVSLPAHLFNFHTAQIVADFLANLTRTAVEIKWPNDLIIKNKKVCGLLMERRNIAGQSCYIVGIGLNVLQRDFFNFPKAGSLYTQAGIEPEPSLLAEQLHEYLTHFLPVMPTGDQVIENLNSQLFRKDIVSVFEIGGIRQNGIVRRVDAEGRLWVELEQSGLKDFGHKELQMLY